MSFSKRNAEGYMDLTAYQALSLIGKEEERKVRAAGGRYRPVVYICSPFSGDTERNTEKAIVYSRYASDSGCIPLAPHLLFTRFLDDSVKEERELGLLYGKVIMNFCHEVWVFGENISPGMETEIERAKAKGIRIRRFDGECKERIDGRQD